jgi:hypothetical protein
VISSHQAQNRHIDKINHYRGIEDELALQVTLASGSTGFGFPAFQRPGKVAYVVG